MHPIDFQGYNMSEDIKKALKGLKYQIPTEVQASVIPSALDKKDLFVRAQTGSGKTAAYAIPICELLDWLENKAQALVLTPTRELAVQVKEDFINIGRFKRVNATAIYGGHPFYIEKAELKQKTHVVVGTPGRVLDHIKKGTINLSKLNYLVIDEADRMFDMGFMEQLEAIIKELPTNRVTMLFSATMTEEVKRIALDYMKDPVTIDVSETRITALDINHFYYPACEEDKFDILQDVIMMENPDSCIIFCSTKERVDMLCDRLNRLKFLSIKMHGGMEQRDRLLALKRFRKGEYRYLIATDLVARGIDVENISLVINYDIPMDKENYVHRTGRTGRAGQKGKAISLIDSAQNRYLQDIEKLIGFQIQELERATKEEVISRKAIFERKMKESPVLKKEKSEQINKDIMKLRFSGGKKKKLRATNFVGVISNLEGVSAEDIGIITILDTLTYIEILNGKGPLVLNAMKDKMVGGKQLKVIKAVDKG